MSAHIPQITDEQLDERVRAYLSYRAELVASRALTAEAASTAIARRLGVGGGRATAPFSLARVAVALVLLLLALLAAVYVGSLFRERYAPDRPLIEVPINGTPSAITAAYGSIWVASYPDPHVYQLDPHDGTVRNRIATAGPPCGAMERGYGYVWFTYCDTHELARVDVKAFEADRVIGYGSDSLGIGADSVWSSDGENVVRLDPASLDARAIIPVGGDALVTFGEGNVWAVVTDTATVYRIDPATNSVADTIPLSSSDGDVFPVHAAAGAGALWVVDEIGLRLFRIDAGSGAVSELPVSLGHQTDDGMNFGDWHVAFARGRVYVRATTDRIIAFNPTTYEVTETLTTPAAGGGSFFVTDDSLWSGNFGTGSVTGIQLH